MSLFNTSISNLTGTSTFYDWFIKENDEIIAKLNLLNVSGVTSGDGVLATTNTSTGLVSLSIGGTSGTITKGLSFAGPVSFLGEAAIPNASYRITGITLGTPGYTFGSVIRVTSNGYTAAKANNPDNAEVIGVLSQLTSSYSVVTVSGKIDGNFTGVAGGTLSAGCVYFLSTTVTGGITATEPNLIGSVSKPVIIGLGATSGIVIQYRGNYLSDDNTGTSGSNRIIVSIDKTTTNPSLYGFSAGNFISYAPELLTGNTFFNQVLQQTGRTAINGWFLSGSKGFLRGVSLANQILSQYTPEEDYIVGMIETIDESSSATTNTYQIVTHGLTTVIPKSISTAANRQGSWIVSGLTYTIPASGITQQLVRHPTKVSNANGGFYHAGFVFDSGSPPSYWFVDLRPLTASSVSSSTTTTLTTSTSSGGSGVGINYAWNGDFEVHQRNKAKNLANAITLGQNANYLSDGWYEHYFNLYTGTSTNNTKEIYREKFDLSNTEIEGNPKYYLKAKFLANPAATTVSPSGGTAQIGHFIDGIKTFNGEPITVSFYTKCDAPLNNYQIKVYIERVYVDGSSNNILLDRQTIGTVTLTTTWTKNVFNYTVPEITIPSDNLGHVRIGFDFKQLIQDLKDDSVSFATANAHTYLASFCVYSGTFLDPKHQFDSFDNKLRRAQRYYYTTYGYDDAEPVVGYEDMVNDTTPGSSCIIYTNPYNQSTFVRFPQEMLKSPTFNIYSPKSLSDVIQGTMFNITTSSNGTPKNLDQSAGDSASIPSFLSPSPTRLSCGSINSDADPRLVETETSTVGKIIKPRCGCIPFDELAFHFEADAAYSILL